MTELLPPATAPAPDVDPRHEIRLGALHAVRGRNYWSRCPVIRMDLVVGAYDHVSSADVPGVTDALMRAMPGLIDHECSIGVRGGFRTRLRRGTYAPHIIEHVALELQAMIGHDAGFGRTRGGDADGEYTVAFEYVHEHVGLRAATLALDVVQRAFAGSLESVDAAVRELQAIAATPDAPPLVRRVLCGVTGGSGRGDATGTLRRWLASRGRGEDVVADVAPDALLRDGLPYARSQFGIVLDAELTDVPPRYRDPERARRLVSVVADGVRRDGFVICPASEWELQDYARELDRRVAIFATDDDVTVRDERVAAAVARVRGGRILIERGAAPHDAGALDPTRSVAAQVATALAAFVIGSDGNDGGWGDA